VAHRDENSIYYLPGVGVECTFLSGTNICPVQRHARRTRTSLSFLRVHNVMSPFYEGHGDE
jgi:hypothetical protein